MHVRRVIGIVVGAIVLIAILAIVALRVITQTDWGREHVRQFALDKLKGITHGIVHIGRIDGNLLTGATFVHVTITDSVGQPFVTADTIDARYGLIPFFRKRIELNDVRLVRPVILLDRQPGGKWNWDRIFPRPPSTPGSPPGFGSWVTLKRVTVVDGHLTSRSPWKPSDTLNARARDSVIRFALSPKGRVNVERVPNGFQQIAIFSAINGYLPLLRLEDPSDARQFIDVERMQAIAQPMRPPSVRVTSVAGRFTVLGDSVYFKNIRASLAESKLVVSDGRYNIGSNDLRLRLRADPVATNDLLWIDPDIPHGGTGALDFALDWVGATSDYLATNARLSVAGATLHGSLGIVVNDTFTFHDTNLQFARLDTRTIGQLFPTLQSPRQGYLTGRMAAAGGFGKMRLDGDVIFDDPISGRSRVIAKGAAGGDKNVFRADKLRLTLQPVQVALGQVADSTLPLDGTLQGTVVLDGTTRTRLTIQNDVTHVGSTGTSRVTGTTWYAMNDGSGVPFVNADLMLQPLSLLTVGAFAPAAGLWGELRGPVRLTGPMRALRLNADLTAPDSGEVTVAGTASWTKTDKSYDVALQTRLFNANAVSSRAPKTSLTADASVKGSGIAVETVNAVATADIKTSTYDSVTVDSAILRVRAANGLLSVDTLGLQIPRARAAVSGTLGLTAAQRGTLRYDVTVDSLSGLARFIPKDTGVVTPRPGILAERIRRARTDSAKAAKDSALAQAITHRAIPAVVVDTPRAIAKSTLSGSIRAQGTVSGNLKDLDVDGMATGRRIVVLGNSADVVNARYTVRHALAPHPQIEGGATATHVLATGFQLDTVTASASYQQPSGTANLTIHQDDKRQYSLNARYELHQEQSEIRLNSMALQFDTVVYTTTQSSVIHYGPRGLDIDHFEMDAPNGSGILVAGSIPKVGDANLHVNVRQFDIANVITLLQGGVNARGLISFDMTARGTAEQPTISGAFGATQFAYNSNPIPDIHGTLAYDNQTLQAVVEAKREGQSPFLNAKGTVPVNLALTTVQGSRIPKDRQIDATIVADSLPLDAIPQISDVLDNLRGRAYANFTVRGTALAPDVTGVIALDKAAVTLVPTGVRYTDVNANIRFLHDTVVVDSIVAYNSGKLKLTGGVGIKSLANPRLALTFTAAKARVLDNDTGTVRITAQLTARGVLDSLRVRGRVDVVDGVVYVPEATGKTLIGAGDPGLFNVIDTTSEHERGLFPNASLLDNLNVNVQVTVDRDMFVRSQDLNVEIYTDGPLRVTVNPRTKALVLDGVVLTDRGEYRFQGRRFQVKQGSATFVNIPDLNPTIQLTAEYEVQSPSRETINIRILVAGTLEDPRISLESDAQPPISQTDLLSYLAFGRTSSSLLQLAGNGLTSGGAGSSNLVGEGAALAARQVSAAALGALTDQLAGQAAKGLGADVLTISPADVSLDAGGFLKGTQVEFGKYIQTRTFLGLQFRLDPASLVRPGFSINTRLSERLGYQMNATFEPRYLPTEPTLSSDQTVSTTSVFGLFFVREWKY